jgi:hypothetical protein
MKVREITNRIGRIEEGRAQPCPENFGMLCSGVSNTWMQGQKGGYGIKKQSRMYGDQQFLLT